MQEKTFIVSHSNDCYDTTPMIKERLNIFGDFDNQRQSLLLSLSKPLILKIGRELCQTGGLCFIYFCLSCKKSFNICNSSFLLNEFKFHRNKEKLDWMNNLLPPNKRLIFSLPFFILYSTFDGQ